MTAFPLPDNLLRIAGVQPLELEVAEASDLGQRMRRVRLTGSGLATFSYQPGQDVMLVLDMVESRPLSRRYSIRGYDAQTRTLELNVVAHGLGGPGARWAAAARPGDRVNGVGPRGKIFVNPTADWHLFVGDESAAPGALHMLESLPPDVPGIAYLETGGPGDELPTDGAFGPRRRVVWLHRGHTPVTESTLLEQTVARVELPPGRGHVYIAGEMQRVRALEGAALERGLAPEQVSPKAYWGRARANNPARGEPD